MEKNIKEDFLIQVETRVEDARDESQEPERIQLMTRGSFEFRNGCFFISYQESEATGYDGCTTTLKINSDSRRVSMIRRGPANAHLIIEKGIRHLCHYDTGMGSLTMGVAADEIRHHLTPGEGGTACFSYALDMDPVGQLSRNYVNIQVRPADPRHK